MIYNFDNNFDFIIIIIIIIIIITFFQSHIHRLRRLSPNLCIESCKMQEAAIVYEYVSYVRVMLTAFFSEVFPLNI